MTTKSTRKRARVIYQPRLLRAKFECECAETENLIRKGDRILYCRITEKVYCMESEKAKNFRKHRFGDTD